MLRLVATDQSGERTPHSKERPLLTVNSIALGTVAFFREVHIIPGTLAVATMAEAVKSEHEA
jgi:hypothetical protein